MYRNLKNQRTTIVYLSFPYSLMLVVYQRLTGTEDCAKPDLYFLF